MTATFNILKNLGNYIQRQIKANLEAQEHVATGKLLQSIRSEVKRTVDGYELLGYFLISIKTWREEYFKPLEKLVKEFQRSYSDKPENIREYNQARQELDMFNKNPERNSSVYFVMKRL